MEWIWFKLWELIFVHFRNGYTHWIDSSIAKKFEEDQFGLNKLTKNGIVTLFLSSFSSINNETAKKKFFFISIRTKQENIHQEHFVFDVKMWWNYLTTVANLLFHTNRYNAKYRRLLFHEFLAQCVYFFFFAFRLVSEISKKNHFINLVWRWFFLNSHLLIHDIRFRQEIRLFITYLRIRKNMKRSENRQKKKSYKKLWLKAPVTE